MKNKKVYPKIFFGIIFLFMFGFVLAAGAHGQGIQPPIEPTTIQGLLLRILKYARGTAGTIGVIFIIIGGIKYILSGGNVKRLEAAKKTVTYAIAGLAIVIAAPIFLNEILLIVGGNIEGAGGPSLQQITINVLRFLLAIAGTLSIISMVVGAMWMLMAYGNEDRIELGKKTVKYSIIGTAITIGSLIIVQQVAAIIGS
jgi:hypothetical protein